MRSRRCDDCGNRERVGFMRDGLCRDCRPDSDGRGEAVDPDNYVSPDEYERRGEAIDMAEQRSRHRAASNAVNQE